MYARSNDAVKQRLISLRDFQRGALSFRSADHRFPHVTASSAISFLGDEICRCSGTPDKNGRHVGTLFELSRRIVALASVVTVHNLGVIVT